MLLLTVVYSAEQEVVEEITKIKEYFKNERVIIGVSEQIVKGTHFLKVFCSEEGYNPKVVNNFNFYMANILWKKIIMEFYNNELFDFMDDTYFFLKEDEVRDVAKLFIDILISDDMVIDNSIVYCLNIKNSIINEIKSCIEENTSINIDGFINFRMKIFRENIESIAEKIVEKYMVEKEYDEFIKLLKYFVDVQESKLEEVNIYIMINGEYSVTDGAGIDILNNFMIELTEGRPLSGINVEDVIISGLITNSPKHIVIHSEENCNNTELLQTIKTVFSDRVQICDGCKRCIKIRGDINIKKNSKKLK